MADGDDPTSTNYKLRMMGLRGDDEDDMDNGRVELFDTAATPIEVGVDEPPPVTPQSEHGAAPEHGTAPGATPSGSSASNKCTRSKVWEDFEELFELRNGSQVRVNAKCNYCKKNFICSF